jgi:hypothetical protein
MASAKVLDRFGVGWDTLTLNVCALTVLMISMARLRQPIYRLAVSLGLFVWLSTSWFNGYARAAGTTGAPDGLCREVEAYVNARTPYGRVFVLGYSGMDLLRGYAGELLLPNMDLHIGSLRKAYKGQNLYVLVPQPEGTARAESVFWKHPEIYVRGAERLLYAEAFGTWHLFEVVSAPTQEQLNEWKNAH